MDYSNYDQWVIDITREKYPSAEVIRYFGSHVETIKRCCRRAKTDNIWVISSMCDYTDFDFWWRTIPGQEHQIHCFASGNQQFGDTFLIPVKEFLKQDPELLEWFKDINYHSDGVPRVQKPTHKLNPGMDLAETIKNTKFNSEYEVFSVNPDVDTVDFDPPMWKERGLYSFSNSGSVVVVPREAKSQINKQLYDYPYILRQDAPDINDLLLDVVFISNGEKDADLNHQALLEVAPNTLHIEGVKGREQAYKTAAKLSDTPWFFAVFGKTLINPDFDFTWQPDRFQANKHYIFHSHNPVNGLEYGHMGVIAYNKELVLKTHDHGLDFTMSKPHAVIPELSCTANFNTDELSTWRTAFREVLKLKHDVELTKSVESQHRLTVWSTIATGDYAQWSLIGAQDALDYYEDTEGKMKLLLKSFDWKWLDKHYYKLYGS
tara:strand:+ start:5675 stop:6973 length:1299 start_codon:yes stop_codon:yes gene_type:complete